MTSGYRRVESGLDWRADQSRVTYHIVRSVFYFGKCKDVVGVFSVVSTQIIGGLFADTSGKRKRLHINKERESSTGLIYSILIGFHYFCWWDRVNAKMMKDYI